jgi:hypothetical protein
MQFLLMCCIDESRWEGVPESQRKTIMEEYGRWSAESDAGHPM